MESARSAYQGLRTTTVNGGVQEIWQACKANCMCLGEAITASSQGPEPDENCVYRVVDEEGGSVSTVSSSCRNADCRVCLLMNKLDKPTLIALGMKRNERLTAMLQLSPFIAHQLNSGEVPEDRRKVLVQAFCELLSCSTTRLRNVANVGFLVMLCPHLLFLNLERGWGNVWSNLSKVATAVGYHGDRRSQLAALVFMRRRCVPDGNRWLWFLQTDNREEEREVNEAIFGSAEAEPAAASVEPASVEPASVEPASVEPASVEGAASAVS